MSPFRSVRVGRLSDQIVEQLQAAIFSQQWKPGEKLPPEKDLAEQFAASRGTVREAIRVLELAGLVRTRPGHNGGPFVVEPTYQLIASGLLAMLRMNQFDLAEVFDARLLIEPRVAELAARHAAEPDLDQLAANLGEEKTTVRSGCQASREHTQFHFLLAKASKSSLLTILTSACLDLMATFDASHPMTLAASAAVVEEHQGLLEAVRGRDVQRARELMEQHLWNTRQHLASLLYRE